MGIAAMVLLLAVSCKKENQEQSRQVTLTAGIENNAGKSYIYLGTPGPYTCWNEGDAIMVNGNYMYMDGKPDHAPSLPNCISYANFKTDNWKGNLPDGNIVLFAIFPATEQKTYKDDQGNTAYKSRVTLPMEQTYIGDNDFMHNLPMGMSNKNTSINFQNLSNVYRLPVYNTSESDITITKVVMRKNTVTDFNPISLGQDEQGNPMFLVPDNLDIVGDIWYPHFGSETQNIEIIGGNSHEITLNCKTSAYPNGVTISKNKNAATIFSFAAFPVQLTAGIEFDFYKEGDTDGNPSYRITKPVENKIDYNRIYELYKDGVDDGEHIYILNNYPVTK